MVDTTNIIEILSPRWHSRDVLIASWRVVPGMNKIVLKQAKNHPDYYMTGSEIWKYPTEMMTARATGKQLKMYVVPLDELKQYPEKADTAPVRARVPMRISEEQELKQIGLL